MKLPRCLMAITFAALTISALLADSLTQQVEVDRRMEIEVEHTPWSSLWIEIQDEQNRLVAVWYAPWTEEWEVIAGIGPAWVEQVILEGWSAFALDLPHAGCYRVTIHCPEEIWSLELEAVNL